MDRLMCMHCTALHHITLQWADRTRPCSQLLGVLNVLKPIFVSCTYSSL